MVDCRFPSKIALRLKKVRYKVSVFENCQRQSCKAIIGLTIHAKMIGGGDRFSSEIVGEKLLVGNVPFYLKFWVKVTALERNRRFSIYFRS